MTKQTIIHSMGEAPLNYARLATLWASVLNQPITPAQVALCLHQFHLNRLIDHPRDTDATVRMAEALFAFEAMAENGMRVE